MRSNVIGKHNRAYIISVQAWGRRLEANECTIWSDGTVTLMHKDGAICNHYRPTPQELRRHS